MRKLILLCLLTALTFPDLANAGWKDTDAEGLKKMAQRMYDDPKIRLPIARCYIPSGQGYRLQSAIVDEIKLIAGSTENIREVGKVSEANFYLEQVTFHWTGGFEGAGKTSVIHVFQIENGKPGKFLRGQVTQSDVQTDHEKTAQVGAFLAGFILELTSQQ